MKLYFYLMWMLSCFSHVRLFLTLWTWASKDPFNKVKKYPQYDRKYLQIIYLVRNLYLEYVKNSHNSTA